MANSLAKRIGRPPKNPQPQPVSALPDLDAQILDTMRKLDGDAGGQLAPIFPDELADPESAKTLKAAFYLGVRFGASQLPVMSPNLAAAAAARLVGQFIADRSQGEGAAPPAA